MEGVGEAEGAALGAVEGATEGATDGAGPGGVGDDDPEHERLRTRAAARVVRVGSKRSLIRLSFSTTLSSDGWGPSETPRVPAREGLGKPISASPARLGLMPSRNVPPGPRGRSGLRRHAALVPLSRDHHDVLVQVLWLRRAAAGRPEALRRTAADFLAYFREEMLGHMSDEEDVLLPAVETDEPAGAARIRSEHAEIRSLAVRAEGCLDEAGTLAPLALDLAKLLDDHVRFEERAFFMRVQELLDPAALEALGGRLEAFRAARGRLEACRRPPREEPQGTS